MLARSTRGASKMRRELINVEINSIRDLLPLHEGVRKRLSQLQVMAICKAFISKSNFFSKVPELSCINQEEQPSSYDFSHALPGFILLASIDGRFLYLSDNVMEVLGHSNVDFITQSEYIYDMFDDAGRSKLFELMSGVHGNGDSTLPSFTIAGTSSDHVTFNCLMGMTKNIRRHPGFDRQKAMRVRACLLKSMTYLPGAEPLLVAFCSPCSSVFPTGERIPTSFNTMICQTGHGLDMKFRNIDANTEAHLGYCANELQSRSWYEFLHPDHEQEFASKHLELISNGSNFVSSVFVRVQTKHGYFIWLHILMRLVQNSDPLCVGQSQIACVGQVLNEEEVDFMREREQIETELSRFSNTTAHIFDQAGNVIFPYSTEMPIPAATTGNFVTASSLWCGEKYGKRKRRNAPGGGDRDDGEKPKKIQSLYRNENSLSNNSSPSPSVLYSSLSYSDADQSLALGGLEDFLVGGLHSDFDLKTEEQFQTNSLSPYSMLSESLSSNSPKMFSEEDHSFFMPTTTQATTTTNMINTKIEDNSMLLHPIARNVNGLVEIKTLSPDVAILRPSPTQEVPSELPELDLADLSHYLNIVEDGKKQDVRQTFCTPSYVDSLWQQQQQQRVTQQRSQTRVDVQSGGAVTYKFQSGQRSELFFENRGPVKEASGYNTGADFSESAFLERLIESPQFSELIGIMAGGSNGRRTGFQERGILTNA